MAFNQIIYFIADVVFQFNIVLKYQFSSYLCVVLEGVDKCFTNREREAKRKKLKSSLASIRFES